MKNQPKKTVTEHDALFIVRVSIEKGKPIEQLMNGLLVSFPSSHTFVHAVPKVLSGKRYSLPFWFIVKSAKAMQV